MEGLYKVTIELKNNEKRIDAALDYLFSSLFSEVEYMSNADYDLGVWTKTIFDRFNRDNFEMVFEMNNDNVVRFWFIDEENVIKQITD